MTKNCKPKNKLYPLLACLTALLCLSTPAFAVYPNDTGPGTIAYALLAPDGADITLYGVCVTFRAVDDTSGFYVREPWEPVNTSQLIRVQNRAPVAAWQTVDVVGQVWTINGQRVISDAIVYAWTDCVGNVLPIPMPSSFDWPWKQAYADSAVATQTATTTSDPIPPPPSGDPLPPPEPDPPVANTIAYALTQPVGASVWLIGQVVTAGSLLTELEPSPDARYDYDGYFYLQEYVPGRDHSCGVRIDYDATTTLYGTIQRNNVIQSLQGIIAVDSNGEKHIDATTVYADISTDPVSPVGMNNRAIGGNDFAPGTPGVYEPYGLYNKGLLIRTWGRVTYVDPSGNYCYIDDGSHLWDGSYDSGDNKIYGVRILLAHEGPGWQYYDLPAVGQYIAVNGFPTSILLNGNYVRAVRQRSEFGREVSRDVLFAGNTSTPGRGLITMADGNSYFTVYRTGSVIWETANLNYPMSHPLACLDLDTSDSSTLWGGLYDTPTQCKVYRYQYSATPTPTFTETGVLDLTSWFLSDTFSDGTLCNDPVNGAGGMLDGLAVDENGNLWISNDGGTGGRTRIYRVSSADGHELGYFDFPYGISGHEYVQGRLWLTNAGEMFWVTPHDDNTYTLHGSFIADPEGTNGIAGVEDLDWDSSTPGCLRGFDCGGGMLTWDITGLEILQ